MTASCFVDTNIFVYFRDASEPEKQANARAWLKKLWITRTGRTSAQVLNEFYVTVTQKLTPGLPKEEAQKDVKNLLAWDPVPIDGGLITNAFGIQKEYRFSWWDSLIVSAAQLSECTYLLSEDLQHEQQIGKMQIINPFRTPVGEIKGI